MKRWTWLGYTFPYDSLVLVSKSTILDNIQTGCLWWVKWTLEKVNRMKNIVMAMFHSVFEGIATRNEELLEVGFSTAKLNNGLILSGLVQ